VADAGEGREGPDRITLVASGLFVSLAGGDVMRSGTSRAMRVSSIRSGPWWLQSERITWAFAAGSVLVLIGVYVGALRRPSEEREPEAVRVPSER
jgi:hypothetical protein